MRRSIGGVYLSDFMMAAGLFIWHLGCIIFLLGRKGFITMEKRLGSIFFFFHNGIRFRLDARYPARDGGRCKLA